MDGDLPSVSPGGTCLNFLTSAPCARFMGASQPTRLCGMGCVVAVAVCLLAFPGLSLLRVVLRRGKWGLTAVHGEGRLECLGM